MVLSFNTAGPCVPGEHYMLPPERRLERILQLIERHKYFWFGERTLHMEWASAPGREEAHSRMLAYYKPIWDKMEPLIMKLVSDTGRQQ